MYNSYNIACYRDSVLDRSALCRSRWRHALRELCGVGNALYTASFLPCDGMQCNAQYSKGLSVCPSFVRLSVKRVHCDETKGPCVYTLIPHERSFTLVFWQKEWLLREIWGQTDPVGAKTPILSRYLLVLVAPQPYQLAKSSIIINATTMMNNINLLLDLCRIIKIRIWAMYIYITVIL